MKQPHFLLLCVVLGAALRLQGGYGDLWLDEATSLLAVRSFGSQPLLQVFTWAHDNNHPLNSLWLYLLRDASAPWMFRLLSLLSGIGSLALVFTWPLRGGWFEKSSLIFLWSFSYLLCLYDSEARGYAPMIFFGLLAWRGAISFSHSQALTSVLLLNLSLVMSSLAHVSGALWFVFLMAMLCFKETTPKLVLKNLLAIAPAAVFLLGYYVFFIRHLPEGSGGLRSYSEVLLSTTSLAVGGPQLSAFAPEIGAVALLVSVLFALLVIRSTLMLWKSDRSLAAAMLTGVLIVPAFILLVLAPRVLYERYLLVPVVLCYFLLAYLLGRLWESSRGGRIFALVLLGAYLVGNAPKIISLITHGRGAYSVAFERMSRASSPQPVRVAFDQAYRGGQMVELYGRSGVEGRAIQFVSEPSQADWYVLSSQELGFVAPQDLDFKYAGYFKLQESYPAAPLSGFTWYTYQRTATRLGESK